MRVRQIKNIRAHMVTLLFVHYTSMPAEADDRAACSNQLQNAISIVQRYLVLLASDTTAHAKS